jgi:hypothetical protein
MINEKILSGAAILEMSQASIDGASYKRAQQSPAYEENLRMMLLGAMAISGPSIALEGYFTHIREECWSDKRVSHEARRLLDILRDPDVLTPSLLASTSSLVSTSLMPSVVHVPELFIEISKIWDVKFSNDVATHLWKTAVSSSASDETIEFLLENTDVDQLQPMQIAQSVSDLELGKRLVSAFSDEKVKSAFVELNEILTKAKGNAGQHGWRMSQCMPLLTLLTAEYAHRFGVADGVVAKYLDDFVAGDLYLIGKSEQMMPELLEIARSLGRLDDPAIFKSLMDGGINHVPASDIAGFVEAGLPVFLRTENRVGSLSDNFLMSDADLDHAVAIAKVMNPEQVDLYLGTIFAETAMRSLDSCWSRFTSDGSCVGRNLVTELHALGFDLARLRGEKKMLPHQDNYSAGVYDKSKQVFTALHALGAYPHSLHYEGYSALHLAAANNDVKAIRALAAQGYDLDEPVDKGAEPMSRVRQDGNTPLVLAIYAKHREAIEVLIELGADVGVKANTGATLMQLVKDDETKRLIRSARTGASIAKAMKSDVAGPGAGAPVRHEGVVL